MKSNPGICSNEAITIFDKKVFKGTLKFVKLNGKIADMGCMNIKSSFLAGSFRKHIEQIDFDFNFDPLPQGYMQAFDTILCLEVLEHLQNPLFFMKTMKQMLKKDGVIYLSTPARPRFLWTEHHFFEMNKKHLIKWIFNPLGLRIIRSKRIRIGHPWWFYLTGFRPFFRIFFNYTFIYEIK